MKKNYGLGIDAGGTYTDSVIYTFSESKVLFSGKAPTIHSDYSIGIANSLNKLFNKVSLSTGKISQKIIDEIEMVSVSTTLATNAIIEGKGGNTGIILIGFDIYNIKKLEFIKPLVNIKGKARIDGTLIEDISEKEILKAGEHLISRNVGVIGIVSEIGPRYPLFEIKAKRIIDKNLRIPVVTSLEISNELNCIKRANTCYLNARLIPIMRDFLTSIKKVLANFSIDAPLMIVKGDGTLINEQTALKSPVEMVLSGPAASVIGGKNLSGKKNAIIIDMGGTTIDISEIHKGEPIYKMEGIKIRSFRTGVKTLDISTHGLGGDSQIRLVNKSSDIEIGPRRVLPICYSADYYPFIIEKLSRLKEPATSDRSLAQPVEFIILQRVHKREVFNPREVKILDILEKINVIEIGELSRRISSPSINLLDLENLENSGFILRSSLTITDLLHFTGEVNLWNRRASELAIQLYANRMGINPEIFIKKVIRKFYYYLSLYILDYIFKREKSSLSFKHSDETTSILAQFLSNQGIEKLQEKINIKAFLKIPIILLGAPARTFQKNLSTIFKTDVFVPEFYDVANAVGAITGIIVERTKILIRESSEGLYTVFAPDGLYTFNKLDVAQKEARRRAEEYLREKIISRGGKNPTIQVKIKNKTAKLYNNEEVYIDTEIIGRGFSVPSPSH